MATAMESFSEAALAKVCGPSGIILDQVFLPSPSELKVALQAAEKPAHESERQLRVRLGILEERREQARIDAERPSRPTYEQLIAKLPESLRLHKGSRAAPMNRADQAAFLAKYNVTEEELAKIPDQEGNGENGINTFSKLSAKPETSPAPAQSPQVPSPAASPEQPRAPDRQQSTGLLQGLLRETVDRP